jgi:hypothetical protein
MSEWSPGAELLTGQWSSSFDSILAAYSDWGAVHGPSTSYTRMALILSNIISGKAVPQEQPPRPGNKQARSDSTASSSSQSTHPSQLSHPIPVLGSSTYQQAPPGRGSNRAAANRSGNRGGFRGNSASRGGASSGRYTPSYQLGGNGYFGYRSQGGYDGGYGYF